LSGLVRRTPVRDKTRTGTLLGSKDGTYAMHREETGTELGRARIEPQDPVVAGSMSVRGEQKNGRKDDGR